MSNEKNNIDTVEIIQNELNDLFIAEEKIKEDDIKDRYKDIAINAWESWHAHRGDMDKILFFGGTMFITIITSTGLISLLNNKELYGNIDIFHIVIFHFIFLIIYLAHSYKRLISDVSFIFARTAEDYYEKRFNEFLDNKFEFISIKNHLTKPGRILLNTFNFGIVIVYILTTSAPFINININNGFKIEFVGWGFILSLISFIILLLITHNITQREIKRVRFSILRQFDNHLKKIKERRPTNRTMSNQKKQ